MKQIINQELIDNIADTYDPTLPMHHDEDPLPVSKSFDIALQQWKTIRDRYLNILSNCKKLNRTVDISFIHYFLLCSKDCYYCGSVLDTPNGVDRVNSLGGYTLDNCRSCCYVCNRAKSNMSTEQFLSWVDRIYTHRHRYD